MERLRWFQTLGSFRYPNFWFKIPIAFFAANLIILYEERPSLTVIFTTPYYYYALIPNILMAYLLISFVFWVTRLLDYHYPWNKGHQLRLKRQIIGGVLIPVIPSFLMATIYFAAYGINIFETVYLSRYLQQIIFMLLALNGFVLYYWHQKHREKSVPKSLLLMNEGGIPAIEIAVLFTEDKHYFTYNFNGEKMIWPHSLSKSWNYLPETNFVTIKRGLIVNRAAIASIQLVAGKITVTLIAPLNLTLVVSQRESVQFKKWWINPILSKTIGNA